MTQHPVVFILQEDFKPRVDAYGLFDRAKVTEVNGVYIFTKEELIDEIVRFIWFLNHFRKEPSEAGRFDDERYYAPSELVETFMNRQSKP